jgi:O-antigen/teichoic acid export membrane protein
MRQIARPVIAIIIMVTLSLTVLLVIDPPQWYIKWGAVVVTFYFLDRTAGRIIDRKK